MNQKKAGVIISYCSEAIKILSSLLYTPLVLRLLGQSEFGLYQLVHSVVAYLSLLSLGFTASYARYYYKTKNEGTEEDVAQLNGMFMAVFLVIALVAGLCGAGMVSSLRVIFSTGLTEAEFGKARILMILMVFNLCVTFPDSVFNCIISAHEQFIFQRLLSLLRGLFGPLITIPVLLMGYHSVGMVLVSTVLTLTQFAVNAWFVLGKLRIRFSFRRFDRHIFLDIGRFTFFIFLNQIINQINWNVDKFLLGRMIGTAAVAVYAVGANLNSLYIHYSSIISSVFSPKINRLVAERNDNHELSLLFTQVGRIQFILLSLVLTGFVFFGKPFVRLWAGKNYGEAFYVALWLMVPALVPQIQSLGIEIQRAKNKHQTRSIVYSLVSVGNVLISIPLIRRYGVIGATIGTAIAITLGETLFLNWYYARRIGLEIAEYWRQILRMLPALALPVAAGLAIRHCVAIDGYLSLAVWAVLYTALFCVCMWLFGMNASEKKLVTNLTARFRR